MFWICWLCSLFKISRFLQNRYRSGIWIEKRSEDYELELQQLTVRLEKLTIYCDDLQSRLQIAEVEAKEKDNQIEQLQESKKRDIETLQNDITVLQKQNSYLKKEKDETLTR